MKVHKDAVCIVVMPNIGLAYIPVTPSKDVALEVRKQSNTECKHKQIDMLEFQNNWVSENTVCLPVPKLLKKIEHLTILNA